MRSRRTGMTLTEVMVATAVFSVLMTASFGILFTAQKSWRVGELQVGTQEEARKALQAMVRELQVSHRDKIMDVPADGVPTTQVRFQVLRDGDGDGVALNPTTGELEWSPDISYTLNPANQLIRTEGGNTRVMANNITAVQFQRPAANPNIVEILLTVQTTNSKGEQITQTLLSDVNLRNTPRNQVRK